MSHLNYRQTAGSTQRTDPNGPPSRQAASTMIVFFFTIYLQIYAYTTEREVSSRTKMGVRAAGPAAKLAGGGSCASVRRRLGRFLPAGCTRTQYTRTARTDRANQVANLWAAKRKSTKTSTESCLRAKLKPCKTN